MTLVVLDGSHGEGGGQIVRTALALSMIAACPFRLTNIRKGRRNPGLMPQHLCAVRAAARASGAVLAGDCFGSTELAFSPTHPPMPGDYVFDVAETVGRGSAGSVSLVLQTLLVPLALAGAASTLTLRGGTHVEWSPPFDFLADSYVPVLRRMGFRVDLVLERWGWYPAGGGVLTCNIGAIGDSGGRTAAPAPIKAVARGPLRRIRGRAVAANLPSRIAERMVERARASLADLGVPLEIEPLSVTATCPGAGIFLAAEYEGLTLSFSAIGRRGKPSESVADEAVAALRDHHASDAAVEPHLADQLLVPLAVAAGASTYTVAKPTSHLRTNAWTIGQFSTAEIVMEEGTPSRVRVTPIRRPPA